MRIIAAVGLAFAFPSWVGAAISSTFEAGPITPSGHQEIVVNATEARIIPVLPQSPEYPRISKVIRDSSRLEVTNAYRVSRSTHTPATLTFNYPKLFDPYCVHPAAVFTVAADGAMSRRSARFNRAEHTATLPLKDDGLYLMACDGPPSMNDVTPPKTTVHFSAATKRNGPAFVLQAGTMISISGEDYSTMTVVPAGYAGAYYWIDVPSRSLNFSIPTQYEKPFALDVGTHTLAFFGVDHNGNMEKRSELKLEVRKPDAAH
jgi:hypothetical protein